MNINSEIWYDRIKMIYYGRLGDKIITSGNKKEIEKKIEELKKDLSMCDDCDPINNPMCNKCIGA